MDETTEICKYLRSDWKMPASPNVFATAIAFCYPDGETVIDFLNTETGVFASEVCFEILPIYEWPFLEGYKPDYKDWEKIGFTFLY